MNVTSSNLVSDREDVDSTSIQPFATPQDSVLALLLLLSRPQAFESLRAQTKFVGPRTTRYTSIPESPVSSSLSNLSERAVIRCAAFG